MDEVLQQFRVEVAERVRQGFDSRDSMLESLADSVQDEYDVEVPRQDATRIVDEELLLHYDRQSTWADPTDCDKLDAAFEELEAQGVVARQHFTCCSTCGEAEIGGEMAEVEEEGQNVVGYAFYHMQDTERGMNGGTIFIKFGAVEQNDEAHERIGRAIAITLETHTLPVSWDGTVASAVGVTLADWRKRRENELPLTPESN